MTATDASRVGPDPVAGHDQVDASDILATFRERAQWLLSAGPWSAGHKSNPNKIQLPCDLGRPLTRAGYFNYPFLGFVQVCLHGRDGGLGVGVGGGDGDGDGAQDRSCSSQAPGRAIVVDNACASSCPAAS